MPGPALISILARSFLSAARNADDVRIHAERTLGRAWRWLPPLAARYVQAFEGHPHPRHRDVVRFLLHDDEFRQARAKYRNRISIEEWIADPQIMRPAPAAQSWQIPRIESVGELAEWLSLGVTELEWLADRKSLSVKNPSTRLRHYVYRILMKKHGGVRLIEAPKPLLKEVQRRILSDVLERIPPHQAAHGFVKGRSIVSFASPHIGGQVVLRLDLENFFPGCPAARVSAIFRTLGYPESVAELLSGLCTNSVPRDVWGATPPPYEVRKLYADPHLPQGSPTSPALANTIAYRLDCRLSGLARTAGAVYTRYADDLAFSGGPVFPRVIERFSSHVAAIALEEGLAVNHRKTRIMRQSQQQRLAGLVVNQKLSVSRRDNELLEAILTNCIRQGPASQNRENTADFRAHLEGRVGFVEMVSQEQGTRLRNLFAAISW